MRAASSWHQIPREPSGRLFGIVLLVVCLILVGPLLLVDVPPLLDYPNHLARATVLAFPSDPYFARFYAERWAIIPDLGLDLLLPPLIRILPVHVAGRLLLGCVVLLPVLGAVAYSRAVLGRWTWWSLGVALVAWNHASLLGFVNFTSGLGLGFLLAAAWITWRDRHPVVALAIALVGTTALFFCHLMGLVCFALLIGPYELLAFARARGRERLSRLAIAAAPFVLPLLLYLLSALGDAPGGASYAGIGPKLVQLLVPFENYNLPLDIVSAIVIAAVLISGRRHISAPFNSPVAGLTLALVAVLFAVAPSEFKGVQHFDTRFAVILGFLVFATLRPALPRIAGLVLASVFLVRMGLLAWIWSAHATEVSQLRVAIAPVPAGSTVFLAVSDLPDRIPLGRGLSLGERLEPHMAALLPIERRAWWPFMFDNESQQPIQTREPYRTLAFGTGGVTELHALSAANLCGFDYVLLLDADQVPALGTIETGRLALIKDAGFAALFAVNQGRCVRS